MKSITVRLSDQLKSEAEAVLSQINVSPTEAINHLYLYLVQHGQLPFRITTRSETPEDVWREAMRKTQISLGLLRSFVQMEHCSTENAMTLAMAPGALVHASGYITANSDFLNRVRRHPSQGDSVALMLPAVRWAHVCSALDSGAGLIAASSVQKPDMHKIEAICSLLNENLTQLDAYFSSPEMQTNEN